MGKNLYLIAGANGSGKSTIAKMLLPQKGLVFVNPDEIAAGGIHEETKVIAPRLFNLFKEDLCPTM